LIRSAFEKLVDIGIGEGRVGAEIEARDVAAIARRDRQPSALWMLPGTKRAAFEIAELIANNSG
jgi:hypothetical protein